MIRYANYLTRLARVAKTGAGLGVALLAASALQAQPSGPNATPPPAHFPANMPHGIKVFLEEAAQADQTEIAMANVAEGKAQNTQVKELARMMRTDHQNNFAQLQTVAQAHGVTLDSSLDLLNQHEVNRLQKVADADFDREYTKVMLRDHVKCIKRFERLVADMNKGNIREDGMDFRGATGGFAVADVDMPDIRHYAQNTLPALRHHLQRSEEAARSAGVDESTISSILKGLPTEDRSLTSR